MSWAHLTLVSDAEIGRLEPEATASGSPWGAVTWANARTEAKTDLEIWLERDHPTVPGVVDRVRDRHNPSYVLGYTSSAYSDITTEAVDDTAEDVALATILAGASDRLYIGAPFAYDGLWFSLLDSVSAQASTITVKYWGNAQWTDISATDGTASGGVTLAQSGRVTWTQPSDWERRDLDDQGQEYYWTEVSVSAAPTAGTAANQVLAIMAPAGLKRCAAWLSLYHILNGLAAQAPDPERWQEKADNYLEKAQALYGAMTVPLDLDLSGGVSQAEAETSAAGPIRMYRA